MGMSDNAETRGRVMGGLPSRLRRLYRLLRDVDVVADAELLAELNQRTIALAHRVDHLTAVLDQADPQATYEIVVAVRDSVRDLAVELTEQANRTSELLAELSPDVSAEPVGAEAG